MISEYTAFHDDAKDRSVTDAPAPHAGNREMDALPLFPGAMHFVPGDLADNLRILGDYAGALRAIADHPAQDKARKEARLRAVAGALSGKDAPSGGPTGADEAVRAALTLRHLLEAHGSDPQPAWRMLQAAGQDITKTAYPDWSDLLTWCRFWAAPMGSMAYQLAGDAPQGAAKSESLAIAVQLLNLVEQAPTHYRWLGRVYLPQRWFREAGAEPSELGQGQPTPALGDVFNRALGESTRLLDESHGLHRHLPTRRLRIATATMEGEARAWATCLSRAGPLAGVTRPGGRARFSAVCGAIWRGLSS